MSMSEINFGDAYAKCLHTFNNVMSKINEDIKNELELLHKAKTDKEKAEHLKNVVTLDGKGEMLDQVLCFMFHEVGIEVEKDDIRDRFKRDK